MPLRFTFFNSFIFTKNIILSSALTALLICKNERHRIDKWLQNVSFADKIIVLDAYSSDGTYEFLSQQTRVELYQKHFSDFASQRNAALNLVNTEWVLFTDADEYLTHEGKIEVQQIIQAPKAAVYFAKRTEYVGDQRVKFSGFQSAKVPRLFKKSALQFEQQTLVHERAVVTGTTAIMKNKIEHFGIRDLAHLYEKQTTYAALKAQELRAEGKSYSALERWLKPIFKQYFNYFIRLGFLDGKLGWQICKSYAYGVRKRISYLQGNQV